MRDFLKKYMSVLHGTLQGLNLTSLKNEDEIYRELVLDSINPLITSVQFECALSRAGIHLDIGFGGGFPLLPLAYNFPEYKFIGIDAKSKKVQAVAHIAKELQLKNIQTVHMRMESLYVDLNCSISFKAVGRCLEILNLLNLSPQNEIAIFFYKGPQFYQLEGDDLSIIKQNWEIIEELTYEVPGSQKRYFLGFKAKNNVGGKESARKQRNKSLVNLSSII